MADSRSRLPAVFMVLGSISSIQIGAALATFLFDEVGVAGTVLIRSAMATVILLLVWRPEFRIPKGQRLTVVLFGLSLAAVSLAFYAAIDRIPLGTAVTLEFTGPLVVALITSRRRRDLGWAAMAAAGILLLTGGIHGDSLDFLGILFALIAAFFWGSYILIGTRLGVDSSGGSMLAIAMLISTVFCLPPGLIEGSLGVVSPSVLGLGVAVGLLSAAIPFSLEFEAMRRLPSNVFGVMMSLEPAFAATVGFVILGQSVQPSQAVAIALVVAASVGVVRSAREPLPLEL